MNNFRKKIIIGSLTTAIIMGSASLTLAQNMDNFTTVNSYTNNIYNDVKASDWFYNDVKEAYNLGLMKGVGYSQFQPNGSMTFAEAITLASNIHKTYNGEAIMTNGNYKNWYDPYVDYAKKNNIIDQGLTEYNKKINRAELVHIFANSLPNSELNQINNISKIPDVEENTAHRDSIFKLYNAGVLRGSGDMGMFSPQTNISRAEISAISNRLVNKNNRLKFELKDSVDITNNSNIKKNLKSMLDETFGYYLPRFSEGELDENQVLNAFVFTSMGTLDYIDDDNLFESRGLKDVEGYSLYKTSKNTIDNFTLKYFGGKVNHDNHKNIYIEEYDNDWAYFYGNNNYYFAYITGDAMFYLNNHRIDNMKRLSNGDIQVKTTTYHIEMGEEETREDKLIEISGSQGYNENLLITFEDNNGNYSLKEVIELN